MEEENKNPDKKIVIVKGNSRDIEISDVKDNLTFEVHENKTKMNGDIVIPENKKTQDDSEK